MVLQELHCGGVSEPDSGLQNAQQIPGTERPAVAEQQVVALLNADAGEAPENVQRIKQFLEIDKPDLPRFVRLCYSRLQGCGRIAVPTPCIMEKYVNAGI